MFGIGNKDDFFFRSFRDHAAQIVSAAQDLEMALNDVGKRPALAANIKEAEHKADDITHGVIKQLRETWLTPLDRNDIYTLIRTLDDVVDAILAVADRLVVFEITDMRREATDLGHVVVACAEELQNAVSLLEGFKNPEALLASCAKIDKLESEADSIFRRALGNIYKKGPTALDPVDILRWRDVFDYLEKATDCANDVANILEGIVLEYA